MLAAAGAWFAWLPHYLPILRWLPEYKVQHTHICLFA